MNPKYRYFKFEYPFPIGAEYYRTTLKRLNRATYSYEWRTTTKDWGKNKRGDGGILRIFKPNKKTDMIYTELAEEEMLLELI